MKKLILLLIIVVILSSFAYAEDSLIDLSECEGLEKWHLNQCLVKVAVDTKNWKVCETILEDYQGSKYKSECYFEEALNKKDDNICNKIEEHYTRQDCFFSLAILNQDVNKCNILGVEDSTDTLSNHCYLYFAMVLQHKFQSYYSLHRPGNCRINFFDHLTTGRI